jgi:hypothetical protein
MPKSVSRIVIDPRLLMPAPPRAETPPAAPKPDPAGPRRDRPAERPRRDAEVRRRRSPSSGFRG